MPVPRVGKFELYQGGAYVARTQFKYMDDNGRWLISAQTGNELAGQTYQIDPGDVNVPDGSIVTYYLWVMAGYDRESPKSFIYTKGNNSTAHYSCGGVTVNPSLDFQEIKTA